MTREQKYDAVNQCETFEELANVILSFAESDGMIQGRAKRFNAKMMAEMCLMFDTMPPNRLTREFGIRQQAMYISHYA